MAHQVEGSGLPSYGLVQFAGHRGLLSLGLGWVHWEQRLQTQLQYGFTPSAMAGKSVHTITVQETLFPIELSLGDGCYWAPSASVAVMVSPQYDVIVNDRFRSYYWPSGIRMGYYIGNRVRVPIPFARVPEVGISAQAGALQDYILYALENESIRWWEVTTITVAVELFWRSEE